MLDSNALASIPLIPVNTAPPAPHYPWPKPYTSAMFLSFDVDAESAWTSKDAVHAQRLITMSYGGYEARVGTPKLLELLDQLDLKATFFVTGWSVDAHPAMAEAILRAGHEIGHHGYHHLLPDPGDPWIEEELERGFEALKRRLGVKPTGYRAPYGEFTEELRVAHHMLRNAGFVPRAVELLREIDALQQQLRACTKQAERGRLIREIDRRRAPVELERRA